MILPEFRLRISSVTLVLNLTCFFSNYFSRPQPRDPGGAGPGASPDRNPPAAPDVALGDYRTLGGIALPNLLRQAKLGHVRSLSASIVRVSFASLHRVCMVLTLLSDSRSCIIQHLMNSKLCFYCKLFISKVTRTPDGAVIYESSVPLNMPALPQTTNGSSQTDDSVDEGDGPSSTTTTTT